MKVQEDQERRRRIQEERTRMMEKKEEMKRAQQVFDKKLQTIANNTVLYAY